MKRLLITIFLVLFMQGVGISQDDVNAYHGETTALIDAIWQGDLPQIKSLLDQGANPNLLRHGGSNIIVPLSMSAVNSDLSKSQVAQIVRMLIDHGAQLEIKDNVYGYTPLMWLISYNEPEAVKVLIDRGASLNVTDNDGNSPLALASKEGHLELVKLLSAASKGITQPEMEKSLCNAVWQNKVEVVKELLIQIKPIPSCALDQAINMDFVDIAAVLLDAGADPNAIYKNDTPLIAAIVKGNESMVNLLLKAKAAPEMKSTNEWTPLAQAAYLGNLRIINILLEAKVEVDRKAGYETAFQIAVGQGHDDTALRLIEAGANLSDHLTGNWRAIHKAAELGRVKVVEAMVQRGVKVDIRNNEDMTPLMIAAASGHLEVVEFLVGQKAAIEADNAKRPIFDFGDNFIGTPLMWAMHKGHQEIVDYLISKGAKPHPEVTKEPVGQPQYKQ